MSSQVGPFTAVSLVLLGGGLGGLWYRSKTQAQPSAPAAADILKNVVPEDFVGGASGTILTMILTIWLALVIGAQVLKGSEAAKRVFKGGILGGFYLALSFGWMALTTPFYSTGFVFNGPKHDTPVLLKVVVEHHRQAYRLAPEALQAVTTMGLAIFIVTMALVVVQLIVAFLSTLPIAKTIQGLIQKVSNFLTAWMALAVLVPSLLLLGAWCCWVATIFTGKLIGHEVFLYNEKALSWIETHTDKMPTHLVVAVFGKLF